MNLAWFTDTLTLDLGRAAHYTLLWGLDGVVLRYLEDGARVPFANEAKLRHRLHESELGLIAVDPGLFEGDVAVKAQWLNDLELLEETARFCARLGCVRIITGTFSTGSANAVAEVLQRATDRVSKSRVMLCVRNGGEKRVTAAALADVLARVPHENVNVCWDPAAALAEGGEIPLEGLAALGDRIGCVIVRDGHVEGSGWHGSRLGDGRVGWADVLAALVRSGYDGPLCMDLEETGPTDALRDATTLIQLVRSAKAAAR